MKDMVLNLLDVFVNTEFMGEERHRRRIGQIAEIEKGGKF